MLYRGPIAEYCHNLNVSVLIQVAHGIGCVAVSDDKRVNVSGQSPHSKVCQSAWDMCQRAAGRSDFFVRFCLAST